MAKTRIPELRTGILTYHYVCNEGALWQASALQDALLRQVPEIGPELLDYRLDAKEEWNRRAFKESKVRAFKETQSEVLRSSRVKNTELKSLDGIIVGSDIVWQFFPRRAYLTKLQTTIRSMPKRTGRATPLNKLRVIKARSKSLVRGMFASPSEWTKIPNDYWLPWRSSQKKISFAASIGYSRPDLLDRTSLQKAKKLLSEFDLISVRDDHTKNFVENLIGREVTKVADPAWLCPSSPQDVTHLLETLGWDGSSKLAGVLFPRGSRYGQELNNWIFQELERRGFSTVSIIDANPAADFDLAEVVVDPFAWWSVIARLDFLLTVRTHPNIAALKFHTPFLNLDITSAVNAAKVSKSNDMLSEFGLDRFCLHRHRDLGEQIVRQRLNEALNADWNWGAVDKQIEAQKLQAEEFIERIRALLVGA